MLLTRAEMSHEWGGARFDPVRDRALLRFVFSQFLYGEVTGVQVGHWLRRAPDFESAVFLAKQATEEMAHVRSFLEIFRLLGLEPEPAHRIVRFLATDFMGGSFAEHTCLEMALGEGFVLAVMYALIDTIDHPGIVRILEVAAPQEERHVAFGEEHTARAAAESSSVRDHLLGLSLVSVLSLERMAPQVRRLAPDHPVIGQMPGFLARTVASSELRLRRMGLLSRPLAELSPASRGWLMTRAVARRQLGRIWPRETQPLTRSYLADPAVRAHLSSKPR
ncbi:MAG: ferritin-like domain-containing protein [Candidatus Eisenbacteria bacterium]